MRYRILLAYDGTNYKGWQIQPGLPTIQGAVETALFTIIGNPVKVIGAGRTDAGVHAGGQVAHFDLACERPGLLPSLNALLPADIRVLDLAPAQPGFHARKSALHKIYIYKLWQDAAIFPPELGRYYWRCGPLDILAMRAAIPSLLGSHDFAAFQNAGTFQYSTVRTIYSLRLSPEPCCPGNPLHLPPLRLTICANGFLKQMVRNITGMLVACGREKLDPQTASTILAGASRQGLNCATAPAHGLTLSYVAYNPSDSFFLMPGD